MKNFARLAFLVPASAFVLLAQGPPPGGFGGGPGFGRMGGGFGPGRMEKVITGAPYSGTLTEQHQETLADGNQISTHTEMKVYRDTQGRVRTEATRTMRNGQTETFVTIFDPVAGFEARLNPAKLTAVKHTLPSQANPASRPKPPAGEGAPQVSSVELGSKTVNGLEATGKQVTMTIPAGQVGNSEPLQTVRQVWTSTALQVPVMVSVTSPRGTSTMQLTVSSQTAPDETLFQIPSNYTVSTAPGGHHGGPPPAAE